MAGASGRSSSGNGSSGGSLSAIPPNLVPNSSGMPQLILASGQLVQGIQGAQLLIPTSQGNILYTKFNGRSEEISLKISKEDCHSETSLS